MASKKKPSALFDRLRKAFMTKDSEGFEKMLDEMNEESTEGGEGQHIHIHMPGESSAAKEEPTNDDDPAPADDPSKVLADTLAKFDARLDSIEATVGKLVAAAPAATADDDADPADDPDADPATTDEDPEGDDVDNPKDGVSATNDSASLRNEFQDAKARAEILAPGVKLPTFDAKATGQKTSDSICVLRRRALRAALTNDNADLVRAIVGDADVSKMTCSAAKMAFHASSELVKQKNKSVARKTTDAAAEAKDINQIHAEFWANRK